MKSNEIIIILVILGGIFIILADLLLFWSRKETSGYYRSIQDHRDVREYFERTPDRPEPGSLGTGGIICFVIGIAMLLFALGIFLFNL
jgi:hypothetical protein